MAGSRRMGPWAPAAVLVIVVGLAAIAVDRAWVRIPPNWQPWGPVVLDAEPSWFARMQINGLAAEPEACYAALDRSGMTWQAVPERPIVDGCGLVGGVTIRHSHVPYSGSFQATCAIAAALYWWEADIQRLARERLGSELVRIDHLGSYACRNVNSADGGRRSQHATANALDIAGFRLADGRTVSVLHDWGDETPEAGFLHAARDAACRYFNAVLGPDYNRMHADHIHFDLGRARICR